tara:strand:- start:97 stop:306 length:210 start_codon:yes stop_codon:yes gene_type:complete
MKFTDSQKTFLNISIKKAMDEHNDQIKWFQDLYNKENLVPYKNYYQEVIEMHVGKLEELDIMFKQVNEL